MTTSVQAISGAGLAWSFVPPAIVVGILYRWTSNAKGSLYALARMLIQLVLVGYVLTFIFEAEHAGVIALVLAVMLAAAGWIALRPIEGEQRRSYLKALLAISAAGVPTLALVSQVILELEPWYLPRYVVPLAGMIFAAAMNAVSLSGERFAAERGRGSAYLDARRTALEAALIPTINTLLAVGLVSLPGMMTGQILSGVPPLVAVKYQIVVMCMVFGASGISAALYLVLVERPPERRR